MIHPDTELRMVDDVVGWGVFATRRLPRGTVTWVQDPLDQLITPAMLDGLGPSWQRWVDHHTFADPEGQRVLCWDLCRSMNHSCRPNCAGTELGFEIALVDIEIGDELTNDYGTLRITPSEGFECRCGANSCRGVVEPDLAALDRVAPLLRTALELADSTHQALAELLAEGWRGRALRQISTWSTLSKPSSSVRASRAC